MKPFRYSMVTVFIMSLIMMTVTAFAQNATRTSPHDVTTARFDKGHMSIYYARPQINDPKTGEVRKIWGGLVPYDAVWRTGANEATLLVTQFPLMFGETKVPAGAYTLFTIPKADGSMTLIINKQVGQWGSRYNAEHDFAKIELTGKPLEETVEQFTMNLKRTPDTSTGTLSLAWENMEFSTGFTYVQD